jgi:hypothetical protein
MIRIVRWSVSTETTKQLTKEMRTPVPMKKGQPARVDYEYERNGTANMFMMFAPLEGWRHVKVTERRTAIDYAHALKELAEVHFPGARKIVLVQDNLNTHAPASLYEAFPAPEARRLVERFEWHYTPKHGSWLDLAESELGVLASQCLDRCSRTMTHSSRKSRRRSMTATTTTPRLIGTSQLRRPASNSSISTLHSE